MSPILQTMKQANRKPLHLFSENIKKEKEEKEPRWRCSMRPDEEYVESCLP